MGTYEFLVLLFGEQGILGLIALFPLIVILAIVSCKKKVYEIRDNKGNQYNIFKIN